MQTRIVSEPAELLALHDDRVDLVAFCYFENCVHAVYNATEYGVFEVQPLLRCQGDIKLATG